jgi:hypothetical protein
LPPPFAQWIRRIEDAEFVLDALLACDPSGPGDQVMSGCLGFVSDTAANVEGAYRLRHGHTHGVVECELRYVYAMGALAQWLLEQDESTFPVPTRRQMHAQVRRLCRMCSELCGTVLKWLVQEAADGCPMDDPDSPDEQTQWFVNDHAALVAWGHKVPNDLQPTMGDRAGGACADALHARDGSAP